MDFSLLVQVHDAHGKRPQASLEEGAMRPSFLATERRSLIATERRVSLLSHCDPSFLRTVQEEEEDDEETSSEPSIEGEASMPRHSGLHGEESADSLERSISNRNSMCFSTASRCVPRWHP